jgi:hypothetical protein
MIVADLSPATLVTVTVSRRHPNLVICGCVTNSGTSPVGTYDDVLDVCARDAFGHSPGESHHLVLVPGADGWRTAERGI